jgi:multiple sugar transport system ATP-binding protein
MASVELHDVVKRYGQTVAVNHVNLKIEDGEFLILLGPSGCGKTTSLRSIAGLEELMRQILIDGVVVNEATGTIWPSVLAVCALPPPDRL